MRTRRRRLASIIDRDFRPGASQIVQTMFGFRAERVFPGNPALRYLGWFGSKNLTSFGSWKEFESSVKSHFPIHSISSDFSGYMLDEFLSKPIEPVAFELYVLKESLSDKDIFDSFESFGRGNLSVRSDLFLISLAELMVKDPLIDFIEREMSETRLDILLADGNSTICYLNDKNDDIRCLSCAHSKHLNGWSIDASHHSNEELWPAGTRLVVPSSIQY